MDHNWLNLCRKGLPTLFENRLDNNDYKNYIVTIDIKKRRIDKLKPWTIRMPDEVLDWLRIKAAKETIERNRNVSMNTVAVDILMKAMRADKKKSG
jgi:hypothetical protein